MNRLPQVFILCCLILVMALGCYYGEWEAIVMASFIVGMVGWMVKTRGKWFK